MTIYRRTIRSALQPVGELEFEGIAATNALQTDGFALVMAGADLTRLTTILDGHNTASPVARVATAWTTPSALRIRGAFPRPGISARADEIRGLLKEGVLNCLSLGFVPDEMEPIDPTRPRNGTRVTRSTALEVSIVSVPLDAGAVVTARSCRRTTRQVPFTLAGRRAEAAGLRRGVPETYTERQNAAAELAPRAPIWHGGPGSIAEHAHTMRDHLERRTLAASRRT